MITQLLRRLFMKKLMGFLVMLAMCTITFAQSDSLAVPYRINCGDSTNYTDSLGNLWHADTAYSNTGDVVLYRGADLAIANTSDPQIYRYERYGDASAAFNYTFLVKKGTYTVKLHFAETYSGVTDVGQRAFDVLINGTVVLAAFDPYAVAGGPNIAIVKTFTVNVTTGSLVIEFNNATVQNAEINGIEILKSTAIQSNPRTSKTMHTPVMKNQTGGVTMYNVLGKKTAGHSQTLKQAHGVYLLNDGVTTKSQVILK